MIKIAHEAPLDIFEEVQRLTDYDYALVHLLEQNGRYRDTFERAIKRGREVILDNSIFELEEAFEADRFALWVERLKPTWYIVPDALEDAYETIAKMEDWNNKGLGYAGSGKIGVVQGKTYDEIVDCYNYMNNEGEVDMIAISFDYSWYETIAFSNVSCKLEQQTKGRQRFIDMLIQDNIWNSSKPHHLLGCSLAQEFKYYKDVEGIRSVDTSNPVVAGLLGKRYYKNIGMLNKPSTLLADLINSEVNDEQKADILYNVAEFKKLLLTK